MVVIFASVFSITAVVVKYDDGNRRLLIDPRGFLEDDVNADSNAFTVLNHRWKTGDKILHNSSTPTGLRGIEEGANIS